jgi:parallel beta-helix repeat protein
MKATQLMKAGLLALWTSASALWLTPANAFAISCGDTVGPGGMVILDADLSGCSTSAAITLVGPVTLDLNGHTISCINTNDPYRSGILVGGTRAKVSNGTVTNCGTGVTVTGGGKHRLSDLTAQNNALGFRVLSQKNRLSDNTVIDNIYRGIRVEGSENRISANDAIANDISVASTGVKNRIERNMVTGTLYAFTDEGEGTKFTRNTADNSDSAGFYIAATSRSAQLVGNTALNGPSNNFGFIINGDHTVLRKNTATNNGTGIKVESDKNNKVVNNTALSNGLDLWEVIPGCGSNVWQNNTFVTSSQVCVH